MKKEPTEAEVLVWIADMISSGQITQNLDGTFTFSEELHAKAEKVINDHPELYATIFPDRVQ